MRGYAVNQALILPAALLLIFSRPAAGDRQDCIDKLDKLVVSDPESVAAACRSLVGGEHAHAEFNLRAKARTGGESVWTLLARGLP